MSSHHSCPYCGNSYRYRELFLMKGKRHECQCCRKIFQTKRIKFILLIFAVCAVLVTADIMMLNSSENVSVRSFFMMTAVNAGVIFLTFLFCPLCTRFQKTSGKTDHSIAPHKV